jgi:hypothetical protein
MKTKAVLSILACALSLTRCLHAEEGPWVSLDEVQKIGLAAAIAEYPIPQGKLPGVLGFKGFALMFGYPEKGSSGDIWFSALTNPDDIAGCYALKIVYRGYGKIPPPDQIDVLSAEVVFIARTGTFFHVFVIDPDEVIMRLVPSLREKMKRDRLTPATAVAGLLGEKKKESNPPPQETPGKVPPAGAPVTPPPRAADR